MTLFNGLYLKAAILILVCQSTLVLANTHGIRYVKDHGQSLREAKIDGTSTSIIEKRDSSVPGYKFNCEGDEGRIRLGLFGAAYFSSENNGVEYNLSELFAGGSLVEFVIRGDSTLFNNLHPNTKNVIQTAIGSSENSLIIKMGNGIGTTQVMPIPYDGLNISEKSKSGVTPGLYVKNYSIRTPEEIQKCKYKYCQTSLTPIVWTTPEEQAFDKNYTNLADSMLAFYSDAVLKLSEESGFTEGIIGFYKTNYAAFDKDLNGNIITPDETPKPFLKLNCKMVRYGSQQ